MRMAISSAVVEIRPLPDAYVPTAVTGWWVDAIVWHLQRGFFGELRLRVVSGRVMELAAKEVLTWDAQRDKTAGDAVGSWWLDTVQRALGPLDMEIVLGCRAGQVRTLHVERRYDRHALDRLVLSE